MIVAWISRIIAEMVRGDQINFFFLTAEQIWFADIISEAGYNIKSVLKYSLSVFV